eukprot:scaffold9223_cov118-Isochrysis_galbana.AAC.2
MCGSAVAPLGEAPGLDAGAWGFTCPQRGPAVRGWRRERRTSPCAYACSSGVLCHTSAVCGHGGPTGPGAALLCRSLVAVACTLLMRPICQCAAPAACLPDFSRFDGDGRMRRGRG